jgi:Tol biopolymer transport system component
MRTENGCPAASNHFEGSLNSKAVGPPGSNCTAAAWSPDGEWIYVSAATNQGHHLWRQKTAGGNAEQITSGTTSEEGIAIEPGGHALITSVGAHQSSIWIHDANGDRQLSSEGYASQPFLSHDGKKSIIWRRHRVRSS